MKILTKFLILPILTILILFSNLYSSDTIQISREFRLFTAKNLQGYLKPFFTSIEESFNSNIFTKAMYEEYWTIALDLSIMGMFIPDSHKSFDAERPDLFGNTGICQTTEYRDGNYERNYKKDNIQPTIYGGQSTAIYSAPQNHKYPDSTYKTVAYPEGNNVTFMSGLPILQLIAGFPTRTQLRLRFLAAPVDEKTMFYYSIMVNQQIDHFFGLFNPKDRMGLALHAAFHGLTRDFGISANSIAIGAHFSKTWDNGFTGYLAAQYEDLWGTFEAEREQGGKDIIDSPYKEIRESEKQFKFDIENFNKFRILGGISYRTGILELHADAGWAAQPILTFGLTFWIAKWGHEKVFEKEKIEQYEKIERIEKIERREKREEKK